MLDVIGHVLPLAVVVALSPGPIIAVVVVLLGPGGPVVIDLPQLVEGVSNPGGMDMLYRDCVNVCTWFARAGVEVDPETLFAELVAEVF